MHDFLYIETNGFAILILCIIFFNIRNRHDKYLTEQKLFTMILLLNVFILFTDTFTWVLDGKQTAASRIILVLATTLYYLLHPFICMVWCLYIDFQINRKNSRINMLLLPMMIPALISAVFSILSAFGNSYFYIDKNNVYHRGQYFPVLALICFLYILHTSFYVIHNRKRIHRQFYRSLLLFSVPPVIGAMIQFVFYQIPLIWVGMTISIVIIFIRIQNEQMYKDYLTGLFNRRQLDLYLQEVIQKNRNQVAGIMLDLNSFKNINDYYGHSTGDEALKYASQILKKSFSQHCFISRFGGDEFVVLLEIKDKYDLENNLREFKENVKQFNHERELPYHINFSIGADIYSQDSRMSGQDFLNHIDSLMYKDKQFAC